MLIKNGDKQVDIPGWALLVGALVVDNIVINVCKAVSYKKMCDTVEKVTKKKEEEA